MAAGISNQPFIQAVGLVLLVLAPTAAAFAQAEGATTNLRIGDGSRWAFLGGEWTGSGSEIRPPDQRNLHSRAIYLDKAYDDLTAEFEYNPSYRETGTGDAGLILRAADGAHYYYVSFPWAGVQMRAKHFWAALGKVSGDGYVRYARFAWVPNVVSDTNRWYAVKVQAEGNTISVWVDGRVALSVTDETYRSGRVGLAGYGWYAFRNVRVRGHEVAAPRWDPEVRIHRPAVALPVTSTMPSGGVTPNGDVLMLCGSQFLRSTDKGRTWQGPTPLPGKLVQSKAYASNTLHITPGGRVLIYGYRSPEPPYGDPPKPGITISDSTDDGLTWSDPKPASVSDERWPELDPNAFPYGPRRPYGPLVETEDGTLISLVIGTDYTKTQKRPSIFTWSAFHTMGFAIRSTDGGANWSGPIELDQPTWIGKKVDAAGALDFTEATGVAIGNTITVLIRPIHSAMMWQCWSHDSGASWEPAVRAPFPGYAQSMVRLASGPILVAKRYPLYSVNVSRDDGVNWDQGTVIDYPAWAMGLMVEVEPDVVLCTYQNADRSQPLLAQRIAVRPDGIHPLD